MKRRIEFVFLLFLAWATCILWKVIDLQVVRHPNGFSVHQQMFRPDRSAAHKLELIETPTPPRPALAPRTPPRESQQDKVLAWIRAEPQVAAPLIALFGALLASLCNVIFWPGLRSLVGYCYDTLITALSGRRYEMAYLDSVISKNQFLPLLPTTLVPVTSPGTHQDLDALYISLELTGSPSVSDVSLPGLIRSNDRLVILGDPGSGKTTTLRYLALAFARARRRRPKARNPEARKRERLLIRQARRLLHDEYSFSDSPLPVLIYLNRWRDICNWPLNKSLLDCIREEFETSDVLRCSPAAFFDKKFRSGQCIFFFDAFDELSSADARNRAAALVGEFAASVPAGNRFIVSSRVVGYKGQLAEHGFRVVRIKPLSHTLVQTLIHKWYKALGEPSLADDLCQAITSRPSIFELAMNPMLLSIIVLVQYVRRMIPDRRHILYHECIRILLERRFAPPHVQEAYNSVLSSEDALWLIQKIAAAFHCAGVREMRRADLESVLIPSLLPKLDAQSWTRFPSPAIIAKNIEERSQLLVERGIDDYGYPVMAFSHLTFQEFLTACDFKERKVAEGTDVVSKKLLELYGDNRAWWEEVLLLYAAQVNTSEQAEFFRLVQRFNFG